MRIRIRWICNWFASWIRIWIHKFWITDPDPFYLSRNLRKKFNILSFLMIYYFFYIIFFSLGTKMSEMDPDPAGCVINWPPGSGISQDDGSRGSGWNIYGSATLVYSNRPTYSSWVRIRKPTGVVSVRNFLNKESIPWSCLWTWSHKTHNNTLIC